MGSLIVILKNNGNKNIIYDLVEWYYEYETIHPYEDFNGRTGRYLLNLSLHTSSLPYWIMKKSGDLGNLQHIEFNEYERYSVYPEDQKLVRLIVDQLYGYVVYRVEEIIFLTGNENT